MIRARGVLVAGALVSLLAGCSLGLGSTSPTPSATPLATPSGIPTSDRAGPEKVAALLFPVAGVACGHNGDYSKCPLSPELVRRLQAAPLQYVEQLCRCTGPYRSPKFTVVTGSDGSVVQVDLVLDNGRQSLDITTSHPLGVWVASDITCAGRGTSTSLFSDAPTDCFAASG